MNITSLLGKWFIIYVSFPTNLRCRTLEFKNYENNKFLMCFDGINESGMSSAICYPNISISNQNKNNTINVLQNGKNVQIQFNNNVYILSKNVSNFENNLNLRSLHKIPQNNCHPG